MLASLPPDLLRLVIAALAFDEVVACLETCRLLRAACGEAILVHVRLASKESVHDAASLRLRLAPLSDRLRSATGVRLCTPRPRIPRGGHPCLSYPRSRLHVSNSVNDGPSVAEAQRTEAQRRQTLDRITRDVAQQLDDERARILFTFSMAMAEMHRVKESVVPSQPNVLNDFRFPCLAFSEFGDLPVAYDPTCLTSRADLSARIFANGRWRECDVASMKWVCIYLLGCEEACSYSWFPDLSVARCQCSRNADGECEEETEAGMDVGQRFEAPGTISCRLTAGPYVVVVHFRANCNEMCVDFEGEEGFDAYAPGMAPEGTPSRCLSAKGGMSLHDAFVLSPPPPASFGARRIARREVMTKTGEFR